MLMAVLMDLDGTLLDTADDFVHVLNKLCLRDGLKEVSRSKLLPHISHGARGMVCATFGITQESAKYQEYFDTTLNLYQQHLGEHAYVYPGLMNTLTDIQQRGLKWGIVTNKYARFSVPLLKKMNLQPNVLVCPDHVSRSKPAPDPLLYACTQLGCSANATLYVGDHQRDIECGKSAGAITAVANWGYLDRGKSADWGADYVLERTTDLNPLIERLSTTDNAKP